MTKSTFAPRPIANRIIQAALQAVDPTVAVKNYFADHPELKSQIEATSGRILVVGAGKAGTPMAVAISEVFAGRIAAGHIIVKHGYHSPSAPISPSITISQAGHPVPDRAGLQATQALSQLLTDTDKNDTVLCLISGGGSALLTLPVAGISLEDLQTTTEQLLAVGATINEFNIIRKHLSQVKGGGLAKIAAPASLYTLILSDVVADPLSIIASGPTVPDPSTFADAWQIVQRYHLPDKLPKSVVAHLEAGRSGQISDTPKPQAAIFARVQHAIIGSNRIAAQAAVAAAREANISAQLLTTFVEGEAREVAKVVAGLAKGLAMREGEMVLPACFVLGGETTVTLRGNGQGGRNQELALATAIALDGWSNILVTCLGTDGTDGPTDAAGAFASGETLSRARALDLEAEVYLNGNDAYNFFAPLDDLIITGPTNTNVNDLIIILVW